MNKSSQETHLNEDVLKKDQFDPVRIAEIRKAAFNHYPVKKTLTTKGLITMH